jgi:hypothetical protein
MAMGRKKWLVWLCLAFIALAATMLLYFREVGVFDSCTLPPLGEIEAMRAIYYDGEKNVHFPVPREKWPYILDALTPAEKDDAPMKWQVIGTLVITKHGGHEVAVELFSLRELPGAFCVWKFWWRVYYRGGESAKLDAALRAAYEASFDH